MAQVVCVREGGGGNVVKWRYEIAWQWLNKIDNIAKMNGGECERGLFE